MKFILLVSILFNVYSFAHEEYFEDDSSKESKKEAPKELTPEQAFVKELGKEKYEELMKVIALTNGLRGNNRPLTLNVKLMQAARGHANTMAALNTLSHTAGGTDLTKRVGDQGYRWSALAENIAQGQTSASHVVNSWRNSGGHYANMVNPQYTEIGVWWTGSYWIQVFGRPE